MSETPTLLSADERADLRGEHGCVCGIHGSAKHDGSTSCAVTILAADSAEAQRQLGEARVDLAAVLDRHHADCGVRKLHGDALTLASIFGCDCMRSRYIDGLIADRDAARALAEERGREVERLTEAWTTCDQERLEVLNANEQLAGKADDLRLTIADINTENETLRGKLDDAECEVAAMHEFRAAPLAGIRQLIGEDEGMDDEAVMGSVMAILVTRQETARRLRERTGLIRELAEAVRETGTRRSFIACWCPEGQFGHTDVCRKRIALLARAATVGEGETP